MKILWIIPLVVTERYLLADEKNRLAKAIADEGHEIQSIVGYTKVIPKLYGFSNIFYCKIKKPFILHKCLFQFRILCEVLKSNADILIFGYYASHIIPFAYIRKLWSKSNTKIVLDFRTVPVDLDRSLGSLIHILRYNAALLIQKHFCDGITCITSFLREKIVLDYGISPEKVHVLSTAADFAIFDSNKALSIRDKYDLNDKFVLLYHGDLSPNRGIQNVITSVALSTPEIPNLVFLIVGIGKGEKLLKGLVSKLNMGNHVVFTGKVPFATIPDYIKSADLGIIPLPDIDWWNLNSPIKMKEYLAMRLPFVATNIQSHREIVDLCGGGVLIQDNDPKTISNALIGYFVGHTKKIRLQDVESLEELISYRAEAVKLVAFLRNKL